MREGDSKFMRAVSQEPKQALKRVTCQAKVEATLKVTLTQGTRHLLAIARFGSFTGIQTSFRVLPSLEARVHSMT